MTALRAFLNRHPASSYFVAVFAISWGGALAVIGPGGLPGTSDRVDRLFPFALLATLVGPATAGLALTGLIRGRAGLRELRGRLTRWRASLRWYAVALLAMPILATVVLAALSLASPVFRPAIVTTSGVPTLLLTGIAVGLLGSFLEELGWTGFAVPALRERNRVLAVGLIVGILWGAWHFLVTFWASGDATGALSLALLLPPLLFYAAVLPAFRVLMVWVYDRSESLPVAMLMHASLIASTLFILLPEATGAHLALYYVVLATALWACAAAVAVADGKRRSHSSSRWQGKVPAAAGGESLPLR